MVATGVPRRLRAGTGLMVALTLVAAGALAACSSDPAPATPKAGQRKSSGSPAPTVDPETPSGWGPTAGELAQAGGLVEAMSVDELASVVLMPGFWGYDATEPDPGEAARNQAMHHADSAADALAEHPFGGVFLRPEVIADVHQVDRLARELHESGDNPEGLPLLVSIDQEGGAVQRLKVGVAPVPSAAAIGATGDVGYATTVARRNGTTLRRLGVTMVLAPVADVDPSGTSVTGSRSYSPDREVAARMVTASMRGYLDAGVVPVVKHFPGLGSVSGDSHRALPVQHKSLNALRRTDLVPFVAAIEAGAPAVMVGHVALPAIQRGRPASISPGAVTGLLRETLGFEGVTITDSQGMGPINGRYQSGEGAVLSLLAGEDLVLNSPYPRLAHRAVVRAATSGRLPQSRLAEAATRVLALRYYQQRLANAAR